MGGAPKGGAPKGGAQKGGAQKGGAQKGGAQKGGAQKGGWPKISRFFFPSSRHNFLSSFALLGSLRGILVVFEAPGPEMCTFGVLGQSCGSKAKSTTEDTHNNRCCCQSWTNRGTFMFILLKTELESSSVAVSTRKRFETAALCIPAEAGDELQSAIARVSVGFSVV